MLGAVPEEVESNGEIGGEVGGRLVVPLLLHGGPPDELVGPGTELDPCGALEIKTPGGA